MRVSFFKGFREASHGLYYLFQEERHFRFQAVVAMALTVAMIFLHLTYGEAGFIIVAITLVLVAEAINTVIERMMNSMSIQHQHWIGQIKDIMASAVLLSSIGASCLGILTLLHYAMRIAGAVSLRELDMAASLYLNTWAGKIVWGDSMIIFVGSVLAWILVAAFLVALCISHMRLGKKSYYLAAGMIATLAARFGVVECIRFLHPRMRPFMVLPIHQLIAEQGNSFPSGHVTFFFVLSTVVFSFNKKLGIYFFAASLAIGIARVVAGVHYVSDVIAGMIVGIVMAWIVLKLVSVFEKHIYLT